MKNFQTHFCFLFFLVLLNACGSVQETPLDLEDAAIEDGIIQFTFFHINDVYEIAPLEGGKVGGMARVASLFKQLKSENENVLFVHSGDFLNPSLLGTLKYKGERIKGRQMVEVMNQAGVDVVTFGNHEFDLKEKELQARLNESKFIWLGTNVLHQSGDTLEPFHKEYSGYKDFVPETYIWDIYDKDGTNVKVGIFGATVNSTPKDYVFYEDFYREAVKAYLELAAKVDVVVGLTHLEMIQDMKLASLLPSVPLIMGGHDHENIIDTIGQVVIAKADANAKTAYVHHFTYYKQSKTFALSSELVPITGEIPDEPQVGSTVEKWNNIQNELIGQIIADPYEVVYEAFLPLDGREKSVRNRQTNLGNIITAAMSAADTKPVDGAILNSGSIRLDDQLEGEVLAMDLFRAMPFGGSIFEVDMRGNLLKQVLDAGLENTGLGGYLQWDKIRFDAKNKTWKINDKPLSQQRNYRIAVSDYLLTGHESRLGFFTKENKDILKIDRPKKGDSNDLRSDIRKAVIAYLKKL